MSTPTTYSLEELIAWCAERQAQYEATYAELSAGGSPLKAKDRRESIRFAECRELLEHLASIDGHGKRVTHPRST